jgi:Xaa-Pro aminopeptidase
VGITRIQDLQNRLAEQGVDALLISQPENRRYLSGFTGSDGWLLISKDHSFIAVDFRYVEQAKIESPGFELVHIKRETDWLPKIVAELGITKLGFESSCLSYGEYHQLVERLNKNEIKTNILPVNRLVESIRSIKSSEELVFCTRAAELADSVLEYARSIIRPGISERNIAWELEKWLRENGSESIPFEIIVASGPNSALPHAKPSDRTVNADEPILIDLGAKVNGYCSDITRTYCIGKSTDSFTRIYDLVLGSQLTALATIKSGMTGEQADKQARIIIDQAGYASAFGHSLGHGVGLATHELPLLGPRSQEKLAEGNVFSVEPGIYLPGWGGIRIEDTVTLQNSKIIILTKASKDATILW